MSGLSHGSAKELDEIKRAARRGAKDARRAAAEACADAGPRLAERFVKDIPLPEMAAISGFWPMDEEIDTLPLLTALHEAGHRLCLPVLRGPGQTLLFRAWAPRDDLVPAGFGTREPAAGQAELVPEVLIVPLLAFDRDGFRLGYGGGFYDRTLQDLRSGGGALAVGVGYAGQLCEAVPRDVFDQRLDWVVTERDSIQFAELPA